MSVLKIKNADGTWESIPAIKGENGKDGAIQYKAGKNISIENNVIATEGLNQIEVQDLIDTSIETLGDLGFTPLIVDELPSKNINEHTIYLVTKEGSEGDVYDEYLYINNDWEHIGSTAVDLSDYQQINEYSLPTYLLELPLYTSYKDLRESYSTITDTVSLQNASKIINDVYLKKHTCFDLILCSSVYRTNDVYSTLSCVGSCVQMKNTRIALRSMGIADEYYNNNTRNFRQTTLLIDGTWENDTFTATRILFRNTGFDMLTLTNTASYTPTANYHPATKKYVDDSIAELPTQQQVLNISLLNNYNNYGINNHQMTELKDNDKEYLNNLLSSFSEDDFKAGVLTTLDFAYNVYPNKYQAVGIMSGYDNSFFFNGTMGGRQRLVLQYDKETNWGFIQLYKEYTTEDDVNNIITNAITGYNATKTQVLKNINGTLTWVDEE